MIFNQLRGKTKMKFKEDNMRGQKHFPDTMVTDGEFMVTEDIFDALSRIDGYVVDFSDTGNEIYLTDTEDDSCYTITVHQDE